MDSKELMAVKEAAARAVLKPSLISALNPDAVLKVCAALEEARGHNAKYKLAVFKWEELNGHLNTCPLCRGGTRCETYMSLEISVRGWLRAADLNTGWTPETLPCWCGHPKDNHVPVGGEGVCQVATCECTYFTPASS